MSVLFIGKRFYTNRDALREKYGRVYQLPWHWAQARIPTQLWLIDYHTHENVRSRDSALDIVSTPVRSLAAFKHWWSTNSRRALAPDTVVASGDCYIGWMAWRIARRLGARFVFDVYDKYDEFHGYHTLPGYDLFARLLHHASARLFASRTLLASLGQGPADCVVPNGLDTQRFKPKDMPASRVRMNLPVNGLLVGYFGGMEPDRGVADLIAAITLLRNEGLDVQLVLGGKRVAGLNLAQPGVLYQGDIPYELMPDALAACDLLAVPYRRSPFMDAGSSNKIAESIICRRPLVATRTPNLMANFPVAESRLDSLLAEPGDPASLARSIRLQAAHRVLVDLPPNMAWSDIARGVAVHLGLGQQAALGQANPPA